MMLYPNAEANGLLWTADFPLGVYQEADGEAEDAAIHFPDLFVAHRYRVIQFIFLICDAHWSLLIIHGNADDLQPRPPYSCCQATKRGISVRHGAHHVAQKFSRTTLPR